MSVVEEKVICTLLSLHTKGIRAVSIETIHFLSNIWMRIKPHSFHAGFYLKKLFLCHSTSMLGCNLYC